MELTLEQAKAVLEAMEFHPIWGTIGAGMVGPKGECGLKGPHDSGLAAAVPFPTSNDAIKELEHNINMQHTRPTSSTPIAQPKPAEPKGPHKAIEGLTSRPGVGQRKVWGQTES